MKEIEYIGEHIWLGKLGNFFLVLSFTAALIALIGFYLSTKNKEYLKFARNSFYMHAFAVIGIIGTMFFMLLNHYYEYQYAWQHSNNEMPLRFILSCFWEGQEGSFLLWTFWNVVLGIILQKSLKNEWEAPVMAIFSLAQVFLASMILGLYVGDYRIGTSPFLLLREHPDFMNLPFVQSYISNPNYLAKITPRGLNPLLMNYWMTIHPPTLFLGFASTLPPFAFAIAGLWNKKHNEWQQIALPWTYFGILILGVGILMGGAWAYEALSFGGFWAWDPVENSSLVPWLVLVGAGHVMIVNKNKGGSLFTTHLLAIGSFLLVLYSTFLTRSGILGESSVHAFTDLGMQGQLVLYVLTFVFICVVLLIENSLIRTSYILGSILLTYFSILYGHKTAVFYIWVLTSIGLTVYSYNKYFPKEKDEEELYSREFWMFLGAFVLLLSALVITYFTSIPVMNKLFGMKKAPLEKADYNMWTIPFAIVLMILIAAAQFLKYKKTNSKEFYKKLSLSFVISVLFGLACSIPLYFLNDFSEANGMQKWNLISYSLLFIFGIFAVLANGDYWLRILKGKISKSGASIAHIGFAMILIGALISTSKSAILSKNSAAKKVEVFGDGFSGQENIYLEQGDTLPMGPYLVTYSGKEVRGIDFYFKVDYFTKGTNGKPEFAFQLEPKIQDNPRMGRAADPDTKHFLNRDIYTHVTIADMNTVVDSTNRNQFNTPTNYIGHLKDTIVASTAIIIIDSLKTNLTQEEYEKNDSLLEVTAVLKAYDINGNVFWARPKFTIQNNIVIPTVDKIEELGLKFSFWKINPEEGSVEINMAEKVNNSKDFIVMKAVMFPYINVLWIGCITMALGTFIAMIERMRKLKISNLNSGE
ncbi:MAG: cytochrome c biogenesis protein CcsA [Bacteroidia bacterium]|nr:cytochrome c biogenesis protein CcsA [Bacteroidia bacterium]